MAWSFINSGHNSNSGSPYTTVHVGPLNCSTADLIVAVVGGYQRAGSLSGADLTDDVLNTYTLSAVQTNAADSNLWVAIYYCLFPLAHGSQDFTWQINAFADEYASMEIYAFKGLAASPSVNSTGNDVNSTSIQPGSLGSANDLIVTGIGVADTTIASIVINSGFSTPVIEPPVPFVIGSAASYKFVSGAENPTWSWSNTVPVSTLAVSFTGTSSGGGGNPENYYRHLRNKNINKKDHYVRRNHIYVPSYYGKVA